MVSDGGGDAIYGGRPLHPASQFPYTAGSLRKLMNGDTLRRQAPRGSSRRPEAPRSISLCWSKTRLRSLTRPSVSTRSTLVCVSLVDRLLTTTRKFSRAAGSRGFTPSEAGTEGHRVRPRGARGDGPRSAANAVRSPNRDAGHTAARGAPLPDPPQKTDLSRACCEPLAARFSSLGVVNPAETAPRPRRGRLRREMGCGPERASRQIRERVLMGYVRCRRKRLNQCRYTAVYRMYADRAFGRNVRLRGESAVVLEQVHRRLAACGRGHDQEVGQPSRPRSCATVLQSVVDRAVGIGLRGVQHPEQRLKPEIIRLPCLVHGRGSRLGW